MWDASINTGRLLRRMWRWTCSVGLERGLRLALQLLRAGILLDPGIELDPALWARVMVDLVFGLDPGLGAGFIFDLRLGLDPELWEVLTFKL